MGILQDVKSFIQEVVEYLTSEEGQEKVSDTVKNLVDLAKAAIFILSLFNHPLTPTEKRELLRRFFEILRKMDPRDLDLLIEVVQSRAIRSMSDAELDALVGIVLAITLEDQVIDTFASSEMGGKRMKGPLPTEFKRRGKTHKK